MFVICVVLVVIMSLVWGMYCGYEFFEYCVVCEGSEEYLDLEKYELCFCDFVSVLD